MTANARVMTKKGSKSIVDSIFQEVRDPGEQLIDYGRADIMPRTVFWLLTWAAFLWMQQRLLILTDQRLIVVELSKTSIPRGHRAYRFSELKLLNASKFLTQQKLTIGFPDGSRQVFTFQRVQGAWTNIGDKIAEALPR